MKNLNKILWGLVLVVVGVIFALNALSITNIDVFFDGWWTLFIIIPCVVGIFTSNEKTGNLIGALIGAVLLLASQNIIDLSKIWKAIIPVIIVIIGLKMIFGDIFSVKKKKKMDIIKNEDTNASEFCATFSGQEVNFDNQIFKSTTLTAVFGGVECDLTGAVIESDALVNVTAIFGGVDITVPDNVNIKITSNSIFGGVSNKAKRKFIEGRPTIYINASCIFGGADIK